MVLFRQRMDQGGVSGRQIRQRPVADLACVHQAGHDADSNKQNTLTLGVQLVDCRDPIGPLWTRRSPSGPRSKGLR